MVVVSAAEKPKMDDGWSAAASGCSGSDGSDASDGSWPAGATTAANAIEAEDDGWIGEDCVSAWDGPGNREDAGGDEARMGEDDASGEGREGRNGEEAKAVIAGSASCVPPNTGGRITAANMSAGAVAGLTAFSVASGGVSRGLSGPASAG